VPDLILAYTGVAALLPLELVASSNLTYYANTMIATPYYSTAYTYARAFEMSLKHVDSLTTYVIGGATNPLRLTQTFFGGNVSAWNGSLIRDLFAAPFTYSEANGATIPVTIPPPPTYIYVNRTTAYGYFYSPGGSRLFLASAAILSISGTFNGSDGTTHAIATVIDSTGARELLPAGYASHSDIPASVTYTLSLVTLEVKHL